MKKVRAVLLAVILVLGTLPVSGCSLKTYKEGYFVWRYYNGRKEINIRWLTDAAKELTYLEFPAYIKGKPVTTFRGSSVWSGLDVNTAVGGPCLETVYLPPTAKTVGKHFFGSCNNLKELYVLNAKEITFEREPFGRNWGPNNVSIICPDNPDGYNLITPKYLSKPNIWPANVSFYYNYENSPNNDFYWIIL